MSITTNVASKAAFLALTRLFRLPLAAMIALTAVAAAHCVGRPLAGGTLAGLAWGVFLLAAASSALNQVQERFSDALMRRTCRRPVACGLLSNGHAQSLALLLASVGISLLLLVGGVVPALYGLGALVWYLMVYTPLKRISPLAVLAGTPCGVVPVFIGWLAAGGGLPAPQPLALGLVLLLWQVPHYWLLSLPERGELAAAGFRVLPAGVGNRRLLVLSQRWLLGLALATLLLPLLGMVTGPAAGLVVLLAVSLAVGATVLLRRVLLPEVAAALLRRMVSAYLLLLLVLILVGGRG